MPSDPFVHLHVASGYSLRYGASHPRTLVERAAEHGMDTLALTDRDGTYGVVKFVQAGPVGGAAADPRRRPGDRAEWVAQCGPPVVADAGRPQRRQQQRR